MVLLTTVDHHTAGKCGIVAVLNPQQRCNLSSRLLLSNSCIYAPLSQSLLFGFNKLLCVWELKRRKAGIIAMRMGAEEKGGGELKINLSKRLTWETLISIELYEEARMTHIFYKMTLKCLPCFFSYLIMTLKDDIHLCMS